MSAHKPQVEGKSEEFAPFFWGGVSFLEVVGGGLIAAGKLMDVPSWVFGIGMVSIMLGLVAVANKFEHVEQ